MDRKDVSVKRADFARRGNKAVMPILERLEDRRLMTVGPSLSLVSADVLPFASERLVFNRIQNPNKLLGDRVHDTASIRLINTGDAPLTIHALSLNSPAWKLLDVPTGDVTIDPDGELDVQVKFVAATAPTVSWNQTNGKYSNAGGVYNGLLTVSSDDATRPTQSMQLAGYWQKNSEDSAEPNLQTIVNLLAGYKTNIASGHPTMLTQGTTTPTYYGEEVVSPYWMAAEPDAPVSILQLGSYHAQGQSTNVSYFDKGDAANPTMLWTTLSNAAQQLLPMAYGPDESIVPAGASFVPAGAFAFLVDNESSDDTLNTSGGGAGHHFRFFPLRDAGGAIVANSYIIAQDYGSAIANWDFQDSVFVVSNVRPEGKAAMPSNLTAATMPGLGVSLQWSANIESNLVGYNVYRATTAGGSYSKLNSGLLSTPGFVDSTGTTGVTYFYRVTAVNSYMTESLSAIASAVAPAWTTIKPLSPTGIAATAFSGKQIDVSWNDVAGESGYKLERSPDGKNNWKQMATTSANVTSYSDIALAGATTYFYRVRSYNRAGSSGTISSAFATTAAGLPAGWNYTDIGALSAAGLSIAPAAGVYANSGSGAGLDGTADAFRFSYFEWSGNGQIVAQLTGLDAENNSAIGGVMFRESLDPSSRGAAMTIDGDGAARFDARLYYGGLTTHTAGPSVAIPAWLKLIRAGTVITGFTSIDGVRWQVTGSATIAMNSAIFVGLATASQNDSLATATFSNVTAGSVPPPLAPSALVATKLATGQITLAWADNALDETGYKIERSTDGVKFSQIAQIGENTTTYVDKGLVAGTTYWYRVRATKAGIDSGYGGVASIIA